MIDANASWLVVFDEVIKYIFIAEAVIKIIGLGIRGYFSDNWNRFDFFLVILTIAVDTALRSLRLLRSAKAGRIARLGKLSRTAKMTRMFRAFKTVRICKICRYFVRTFKKVNDLFYKTVCTFPSLLKMLNIIIMLFYIYAIIGCELFHIEDVE